MTGNRKVGIGAAVGFIATVWLANWSIQHIGTVPFPGGPHTIPVGFGQRAPSGVLWIGAAFLLRDVVQAELGKVAVFVAVLVGAALSWFVAPSFAVASGVAFLVSELADMVVYSPLVERGRVASAVVLSNTVGATVDSFVFLWVAFSSTMFWQGQVIGKMWVTAVVLPVLWWMRGRR